MSIMARPVVSVCIPVYNCEKYIGYAIESVLAQTYENFELVILDNCSSDRTREVIGTYRDPRIRVFEHATNIGPEGNWNRALVEAKGKLIKLLCADDTLHPDCLEKQVAVMEDPANDGVVIVCCGRDIIDERGKRLFRRNFRGKSGRLAGLEAVKRSIRAGTNLIGETGAVLIRADIVPQVGGFNVAIPYVIDLDYWCRVLLCGDIFIISESLCNFRVAAGSWSVSAARTQGLDVRKFIEKLVDDPRYQLGAVDKKFGVVMSSINQVLRQLIYARTT